MDVAVRGEGAADAGELIAVAGQIAGVQRPVPQEQDAGVAVADEMDGAYIRAARQGFDDLEEAVLARIDEHDLGVGIGGRGDGLVVADPGVDEDEFHGLIAQRHIRGKRHGTILQRSAVFPPQLVSRRLA